MAKVQRCCSVDSTLVFLADSAKLITSQELTRALCSKLNHPKDGEFCFCREVRRE